MKLFRKPLWIILTAASITVALSAIVGVSVGVKSYNNSYYSYLNKSPELHTISGTSPISAEEFKTIVTDLKLKSNFSKMSAKTALDLAKSKLYQLDLTSAYDFDKLKAKNFQVSFDFENATVEGDSIKNVVVFAKSEKDQTTLSQQIELKGFAKTDAVAGNLNKFQIDQTKSFVDVSRTNLTLNEFKNLIEKNYQKATQIGLFAKLEQALISTNASLSLYNSLEEPVFLSYNNKLEPVLDTKKQLSLTSKNNKLYLPLIFKDEDAKTTLKLELEVRGLISNQDLTQTLKSWFETNFENKIEIKDNVQKALVDDKISLVDYYYNSKSGTETQKVLTNKNFSDVFKLKDSSVTAETQKGTYTLKISPQISQASQISAEDKKKLVTGKKVRFQFLVDVSRDDVEVAKQLPVSVDLNVDLNQYERVLGSIFGSVNSVKEFSMPNTSQITLSSDEIKATIDKLFELAKKENNLNEPSDEVISNVYLLDHGKYPSSEEKEKAKEELKKAVEAAKQKAGSSTSQTTTPTAPAAPKPAETPKPAAPAPAAKPAAAKPAATQSSSAQPVSVSAFSDVSSAKFAEVATDSSSSSSSDQKIGTNVWTTINASSIYDLNDAKTEYKFSTKENKLVFDFQLVSKTDDSKVFASSKMIINDIIDSSKSAYDSIKKFNPKVFLDATIAKNTDKKDKKDFELKDLSDNKYTFKSEDANLTSEGLELKKALKFEDNTSKVEAVSSGKGKQPKTPAPKPNSRLDSGALYLAFSAKNIKDEDQHYLLADKDGKGIFIQKLKKTTDGKNVYVFGMDYKQLAGYMHLKTLGIGSDKKVNIISLLGAISSTNGKKNSMHFLDKQQVLVTSGFPRDRDKLSKDESIKQLSPTTNIHGAQISLLNTEKLKENFSSLKLLRGQIFADNKTKEPKFPTINDYPNNVYFRQDFYSPRKTDEQKDVDKEKFLFEEGENLLLEIIKTPFSIQTTLYSSNSENPKDYKEVGNVVYNIDVSRSWDPFPNFFNLDWNQIGPVEKTEATKTEAAKPVATKTEAAKPVATKTEATKPVATKTEATKTEAAKPVVTKAEAAKPTATKTEATKPEKPASITLKALAVFDDPAFTSGNYAQNRNEILDSFINSYIKR